MSPPSWWRATLLAAASMAIAAPASAQHSDADHPKVMLDVHPCLATSEAIVRQMVRVELGALVTDDTDTKDVTRVFVDCQDQLIRLRVDDPLTGKSLTRLVDVIDQDLQARPRLVALAVAELVAASWTELETNPMPEVPPAGVRPPSTAVNAARRALRSRVPRRLNAHVGELRILAVASRRSFFSDSGALWGGGVRIGGDQFANVGWTLDIAAEHGEQAVSLGTVSFDTFTAGAALYLYRRWSVVAFQLGVGLRAGAARLSGQPSETSRAQAASGVAPWGWPTATAGLRIMPIGPIVVEMVGETGYVVLPMSGTASGEREVTVQGAWLGAQLCAGFTL